MGLIFWTILLPSTLLAWLPATLSAWQLMWLLSLAVYSGCKQAMWQTRARKQVGWSDALAWWLAWPGMNIDGFLAGSTGQRVPQPRPSEWLLAGGKLLLGLLLLGSGVALTSRWPEYWQGWLGMLGIAFALHFGLFHLLSCAWRARGIAAPPLMNWPVAAQSVGDYWGNRWNRAFRDLATRNILRPLLKRFGTTCATFGVFLFSGLIHDLVISFPAGGGYGLPTLYFLIQGAAQWLERSTWGRQWGLGEGWKGRCFAWLIVVLPAPLLFHPPFVERVVVPFVQWLASFL